MHKILLTFALLLIFTNCQSLEQFIGHYNVGKQCDSVPCPRTKLDKYDFACPLNGKNGRIYKSDQGIYLYYLYFKTYNMVGFNSEFYAKFTRSNLVHDYYSGESQLQIPMKNGYVLNLMPCYKGKNTSKYCTVQSLNQLVVWKTDKQGKECDNCSFTMTKYSNSQLLEQNNDIDSTDIFDLFN